MNTFADHVLQAVVIVFLSPLEWLNGLPRTKWDFARAAGILYNYIPRLTKSLIFQSATSHHWSAVIRKPEALSSKHWAMYLVKPVITEVPSLKNQTLEVPNTCWCSQWNQSSLKSRHSKPEALSSKHWPKYSVKPDIIEAPSFENQRL